MIKLNGEFGIVYLEPSEFSELYDCKIPEMNTSIGLKNGHSFAVKESKSEIIRIYKKLGYAVWEEDSQDEKR